MLSNRVLRCMGALFIAASFAAGGQARAQTYPDRPVKMIVGFAAGGTIDTLSRILADKLGDAWKQSVIVDNRPGGGGNIGSLLVAHAEPDGLTLLMGGQQLSSNVTFAPAPNFDPAKDLAPVIFIGFAQDVLMVGKDRRSIRLKISSRRRRPSRARSTTPRSARVRAAISPPRCCAT